MIESSSGRPTLSGPGTPLLLGIGASAGLLIAFLIGFQLGSAPDRVRTVIIGPSSAANASAEPPSVRGDGGLIQQPHVADVLQQAYYANLRLGSWVVCEDGASLSCRPAPHARLEGTHAFDPATSHWPDVPVVSLPAGPRTYLMGDLDDVFVGNVDGTVAGSYDRLLGVSLNGSVDYFDLGSLAAGDYVVLDQSRSAFSDTGPTTFAVGLTIRSSP